MAGAIARWGVALPDTVVTNADLEARPDTTGESAVIRRAAVPEADGS